MASANFKMVGVNELAVFMRKLPKQLDNPKVWGKIFRQNSKPLVAAAQGKAPNKTNQLVGSIGYFTTRASRAEGGGYVGPRVKGKFAKRDSAGNYYLSGYYGAFVETGDYRFGKGKATPFMKPAYISTKDLMVKNILVDGKKVLFKEAKRLAKFGTLGF